MSTSSWGRWKRIAPRLYAYTHKDGSKTYSTITAANERINLGNDAIAAKRLLNDLSLAKAMRGTVAEMIDDQLTYEKQLVGRATKPRLAPRTYEDNCIYARELKAIFGKAYLDQVTAPMIHAYLQEERGLHAPVRANREITWLDKCYRRQISKGVEATNPCENAQYNKEEPHKRPITDVEWTAFIEFARQNKHIPDENAWYRQHSTTGMRLALGAELAYLSGKALGLVVNLKREAVTGEGIYWEARKGGALTLTQWTDRLRAVVQQLEALAPPHATYVLTNREGDRYTRRGFQCSWQRLQVAWEKAGRKRFRFHDIRHRAVTTLLNNKRSASDVTGHKLESTVKRIYDQREIRTAPAVE